ncbi:hypothetical protein DS909_09520 [Phaeobacter gallaeciensis]|uniref:Uncharacterized protein n=1 Tax=Phaeobacter gallaeciensis TaxID=60890 RepID=A0A366X2Q1_9RHOB|nr:hypothetical protein DS909_09520 [Phaeobacter gallaeciensis]
MFPKPGKWFMHRNQDRAPKLLTQRGIQTNSSSEASLIKPSNLCTILLRFTEIKCSEKEGLLVAL